MADIKVGMKVDGLSQFKSAMTQGKQAVKTLDAELKLNAAQYKASGNAEEYMKQKAQLLKQQISEQEKVVKAATDALVKMEENGVKKSSSAYQTMAANVAQAKTRLVEMQNSLNGLGNELSDTGNQARGLGGELADIGNNVSSLNKKDSLSKLSSALGAVEDKAKAVVAGIVNIGKKWWQLEVDASYWADDLLTRATIYEMDTTTLQQWEFAAKKVDTSVESIVSSRQKLMRKLPNEDILARQGGGVIGLGELGDIIYEGKTIDDVFWDVLETVGNMDDALTRDKYAQELFGRSWSDLLPLMTAGREEWEAWGEKAPILTPEEVETLGKANDAYETMQDQITALENKVAVGFAPAFQSISDSVTNLLGTFATWLDSEQGQAVLNKFTEAVTTFLDSITEEDMQNIVNTLAEGFETALGWVSDIVENIDKIGPGLVAAFALLKGSEAFVTVMNLANTLKSLFGGGGNKTPTPPTNTPTNPTNPTTPVNPTPPTNTPTNQPTEPTAPTEPTEPVNPNMPEFEQLDFFDTQPQYTPPEFTASEAWIMANDAAQAVDLAKAFAIDAAAAAEAAQAGYTLFSPEALGDAAFYGSQGIAALSAMTGEIGLSGIFAMAGPAAAMIAEGIGLELFDSWFQDAWAEVGFDKYDYNENTDYWDNALDAWSRAESDELFSIIDVLGEAATIMGDYNGKNEQEIVAAVREKFGTDTDLYKTISEYAKYIPRGESLMNTIDAILDGSPISNALVLDFLQMTLGGFNRLTELGLDSEANAAGESLAGDIVEGASSAAPMMFDSGLSLGAAAVAGFNAAYGGLLGAGGARPTPSSTAGNGPIYNGGNLYVGAMTMNNGMDAAALLGTMNAANRRASAGHGG